MTSIQLYPIGSSALSAGKHGTFALLIGNDRHCTGFEGMWYIGSAAAATALVIDDC